MIEATGRNVGQEITRGEEAQKERIEFVLLTEPPRQSIAWPRLPLLILFLLTYAITVSRYFATTTTKVERLTSGEPRTARGGGGRRAGAGRS